MIAEHMSKSPPRGTRIDKKEILVVESDPSTQKMLKRFLESEEYEIEVASCGKTALGFFMTSETSFSLVILDYLIDGINGLALAESIRSLDGDIEIIMIAGSAPDPDILQSLRIAALVSKPFTQKELLKKVKGVLEP